MFHTCSYKKGEEDKIKSIVTKSFDKDSFSRGGNSECFLINYDENDYAVLKTTNIQCYNLKEIKDESIFDQIIKSGDFNFKNVMNLTNKHVEHNAVPILGYVYDENSVKQFNGSSYSSAYVSGYIVQPKAHGEELFKDLRSSFNYSSKREYIEDNVIKYLEKYKDIPPQHFSDFLKNFYEISKDLQIDPSKTKNFFYDKEEGFSFIDLNFANHSEPNLESCASQILSQFRFCSLFFNYSEADIKSLPEDEQNSFYQNQIALNSNMAKGFLDAGLAKESCAKIFEGLNLSDELNECLYQEETN